MSSVLLALQAEVAERLSADSTLAAVPVLTEQLRNLSYEVQQQVDSLGLVCVVLTPEAGVRHPEAPGPVLDRIAVTVRISENVALNAGLHALEVAERVAGLVHQFQAESIAEALFAAERTIVRREDEALVIYDVCFESRDGLSAEVLP